jgi:predicted phage terminase large subunit-like protein
MEAMIKDRKVRTAITKESHWYFFHLYFAHYIKFPTADFQKDIIALTENEEVKNLFIVAFRGSGKSTIITTSYPLWAILGKQQKKFILILGQTHNQAKQHMMNLKRELESNDLLKNDLGPFQEESDEWGSTSLVFSNYNARITAASTEQGIRGLRHNQYRPDLIIGDDIEDLNSTKTREGRNKTYNWLMGEVIPAGDKNTRLIIVGNLLHEDSLLMRIRESVRENRMDGVFKFIPLLDENDKIMWPGKYQTLEDIEIEKKRTGDNHSWQREYMLRILPTEDQVIHREWIQYYDELPSKEGTRYEYTWGGVDLAISEKSTADYTAIVCAQVHGRRRKRKIYILPNPFNKRIVFPDLVETCRHYIKNVLHNGKLLIESVAFQASLEQLLHRDGYHVEGVKIHGDKRSRLSMTSALIQNGTILFPRKGAEELIQQLVGFGVEKHDDMMDAFTLLINKLTEEDNEERPNIWFLNDDGWVPAIKYDDEWGEEDEDEEEDNKKHISYINDCDDYYDD